MGQYLYGLVLTLFFLVVYVVFQETQLYQEQYLRAKNLTEEAVSAAAQYPILNDYGDGYYNFNQAEGNKALEYFLKKNFNLDGNFEPLVKGKGYWQDKISYEVTYIDYGTPNYTSFPNTYSFTHFGNTSDMILSGPSVILTIDLGLAPQRISRLFKDSSTNIVTAVHTFEE